MLGPECCQSQAWTLGWNVTTNMDIYINADGIKDDVFGIVQQSQPDFEFDMQLTY